MSGDNKNSICDGICYDVKSTKSNELTEGIYWAWHTNNKRKEEIEIYYLLAFNKYWTKLEHAWRVPSWEIIESDYFYIARTAIHTNTRDIKGMKGYEITDEIREVLNDELH